MATSSSSRRRTQTKTKTTLLDLPHCLITEILSRLPIWTVAHCLSLSKTLYASVHDDPRFVHLHLSRSSQNPLTLLFPPGFRSSTHAAAFLLDDHPRGRRISGKKSIVAKFDCACFPPRIINVLCSCNGLLLCVEVNDNGLCICNPIRRSEWVRLPKPPIVESEEEIKIRCGLGFCPETNSYKVVRIVSPSNSSGRRGFRCDVLTLGGGISDARWRFAGDAHLGGRFKERFCGWTTLNGNLHDLFLTEKRPGQSQETEFISCFKIGVEEFMLLVPLPVQDRKGRVYLSALMDSLCVTYVAGRRSLARFEIWVMNYYGVEESWSKTWVIEDSDFLKSLRGVDLRPLKFREEDGELVLEYLKLGNFGLVSYHPGRNQITRRKVKGLEWIGTRISHVLSFVSPRDVVAGAQAH